MGISFLFQMVLQTHLCAKLFLTKVTSVHKCVWEMLALDVIDSGGPLGARFLTNCALIQPRHFVEDSVLSKVALTSTCKMLYNVRKDQFLF